MAEKRGEGFVFIDAEDFARMINVQQAKEELSRVFWALDKQLLDHSKSGTIREINELLIVVRRYSKLIPSEVFDEFTVLIGGLLAALASDQDQIRRRYMVKIEEWHASKPRFIFHLPELRQIVFS